jgi:galactokinase
MSDAFTVSLPEIGEHSRERISIIKIVTKFFQEKFGNFPSYIVRAPWHVNLLGEYVDYNNGFVLPAAIDRATYLAFDPSKTDVSTLFAADFNQRAIFSPETLAAKTQIDTSFLPDWAYYPAGVLWSLREAGLSTPPLNALFLSDVPGGAGLNSFASVETAFVLAWQTLGGWLRSPMECGGCTVNLVKRDHADEFVSTLGKADQDKCGYQGEIYICKASDGAKLP